MRLLEGYVALDLTDLRGQLCGKLLRDLGMEVIKIEPPSGDPVRRLGPFSGDEPHPEGSLRFAYLNAGKKSVVLNLNQPEDGDRFLSLVGRADVLLESFDPGGLAAIGLDRARLGRCNPDLVVTSVTGFGQEGPYRDYLCPDLVGLAMGGLLALGGHPSLPPVRPPETQGFYFAGVYAALATVLALWLRAQDGRGRIADIAAQQALTYHESIVRIFGHDDYNLRRAGGQHPHSAPADLFPTKDGYIHMFIGQPHWRGFLACWAGHPPELDDARWEPNHVRRAHAEWLTEQFSAFTRQYTRDELVDLFQGQGIPCLPMNTPAEFMRDEHVRARRVFMRTSHPVLGDYAQVAFPALIDGERVPVAPPPVLGEHTTEISALLGGDALTPTLAQWARVKAPPLPLGEAGQSPRERARTGEGWNGLTRPRVIALTTSIAGPHAGRALAQCGAEVIKIESRQGGLDAFRYFTETGDINASSRFIEANMNVLSAQLNLKRPEGVRLLKELVGRADVVMDNFGPDVLPRLGLGADELRSIKPDLIVLKMPGLGSDGPKHLWRTWGPSLNAFTGTTHLWNHPGQERPYGYLGVYPDYVTAALAPALVFAALLYRQRTGRGLTLDLAQAEVAAYMLGVSYLEGAVNGCDPEPVGNDWPHAAPHNCYPCAGEDRWCVIAVETDDQWRCLCREIGRPELADDPHYATLASRRRRLPEIDALVARWTSGRDPYAIMRQLQAVGVPSGVVQVGEDLFADPQLAARGAIVEVDHSRLGHVPVADLPLRLSDWSPEPARPGPSLGEHNHYVFCELLGYSEEQLTTWQQAGIVD